MKTILVFWTLVATGPAWADDADEYYDDYHLDDYHLEANYDEHLLPDYVPTSFTASPQQFSVEVNDDITFPCDVKNIKGQKLMFRHIRPGKGNSHRTLFVGDEKMNQKGYNVEKSGNSFILSGIARRHAGRYECRVETYPVIVLTHTLKVQYPATAIRKSPEVQRVVKGSSVTLECKGQGNPKAAISWSRKQGHLPSGAQAEEGSSLTFENVDRHVEGVYICTAANGIGDPSSAEMTIEVEYPPEIISEQATVHTDEGDQAKLLCIIHGRPAPTVQWTRDGRDLSPSTHMAEHDGAHRHTLTISHVKKEDFGNYTCKASNKLGEKTHTLTITGVPKTPTITSSPAGGERFSYTLTWNTESYSPILQYRIRHKKIKAKSSTHPHEKWITRNYSPGVSMEVLQGTKVRRGPMKSMTHTLTNLEPATDYDVTVSIENRNGWSEQSSVFHFNTRKEHALDHSSNDCSYPTPSAALLMTSLWAFCQLS